MVNIVWPKYSCKKKLDSCFFATIWRWEVVVVNFAWGSLILLFDKKCVYKNKYLDIKAHIMQKYMIDGAGAILVKSFFLQKAWTKIQLAAKLRYSSN